MEGFRIIISTESRLWDMRVQTVSPMGVFGRLQADTVAAVWTAAAAIHREKNTVEAAAAAGLQPQQAAANKPHHFSSFFEMKVAPDSWTQEREKGTNMHPWRVMVFAVPVARSPVFLRSSA
jgi:hypothetical protein